MLQIWRLWRTFILLTSPLRPRNLDMSTDCQVCAAGGTDTAASDPGDFPFFFVICTREIFGLDLACLQV